MFKVAIIRSTAHTSIDLPNLHFLKNCLFTWHITVNFTSFHEGPGDILQQIISCDITTFISHPGKTYAS